MTFVRPCASAHKTRRRIAGSSLEALQSPQVSLPPNVNDCAGTLRQFLDANVVELLCDLHDELGFVDLDDDCSASGAPTSKSKPAESVLDILGYIYCLTLVKL